MISFYEQQTQEEAVAEDEAAFENGETLIEIPKELLPATGKLIAKHQAMKK